MTQTAIEIIKQYLIDNDFDGLCNEPIGCGCELTDLKPCDSDFSECKPGYKYRISNESYPFMMFEELQEGMERIK